MELRRLRYFVTVAEERHITRAALRLGMAQPPLSKQIAALEAELGTKLFDRLPNGVALTPAGEALLEDARLLLGAADDTARRVRRIASGEAGEVSAGMTTSASLHPLVPRLLGEFRASHPGVVYDLHENNAAELTEAVLVGRLSVAIMRAPVAQPATLSFIGLGSERMLAALPAAHGLALREKEGDLPHVDLAALAGFGFILVRRHAEQGLYSNIIEACRLSGFEPNISAEVGRMLVNLNLVAAGVGVSCVPESMSRIGGGGVVFAALDTPPAARALLRAPLTLVHRADETRPVVLAFIAAARRLADE
jgi:DNA-binding transcriptional LysR family regulator